MNNTQSENIWGFDVLKFTLAIIIVSLHAGVANHFNVPWSEYVRNLQNLAVPCFFLISSILFFKKVFNETDSKSQWRRLWKYEKRLFTLYLIWQVILLPISLITNDYLQHGLSGILLYLKDMVFSYTFPASWFFGALIVAMPLVFLLRKHRGLLMGGALLLYVYFMTRSIQPQWMQYAYDWYRELFAEPRLSFPEAFVWLSIGCCIADRVEATKYKSLVLSMLFGGGIALSVMVNWCQIIGVLALLFLFLGFDYSDNNSNLYVRMRQYSTLFYCMHFTIIHILWQRIPSTRHIFVWIVTVLICFLLSEILVRLSKKDRFKFLKYLM